MSTDKDYPDIHGDWSPPKVRRHMTDQEFYDWKQEQEEAEAARLRAEAEPIVSAIEKRLHQEHLFNRLLIETGIHEEVLHGLLGRRVPEDALGQQYNCDSHHEALQKLTSWLDEDRLRRKMADHAPTPTFQAIFNIIVEAKEASLLEIVVGDYGIGKSKAAEAVVGRYPRSINHPGAVLIELRKEDYSVPKCLSTLLRRLRHDSIGKGGYSEVCRMLRPGDVMILDEANYLAECGKGAMVDVLRDLWRDTGAGIVLLGNPVMRRSRDGIIGNDLYGAFLSRAGIHDFTGGNTREDVEAWMLWKGLTSKKLANCLVRLATSRVPGQYGGIRCLENIVSAVNRRHPDKPVDSDLVLGYLQQIGKC